MNSVALAVSTKKEKTASKNTRPKRIIETDKGFKKLRAASTSWLKSGSRSFRKTKQNHTSAACYYRGYHVKPRLDSHENLSPKKLRKLRERT